jgi:ABC-type multidrug transport system ATPase subunit
VVIQGEYGISRAWYWPLLAPIQKWRDSRNRKAGARDIERGSETMHIMNIEETMEPDHTSGSPSTDSLIIAHATKTFANKEAVRDVSLVVKKGEILALLGPNGAGKTTLINCILGLYKFTSGTAYISGNNILIQPQRVYSSIGICPQHEIIWPDLTVEEHLLFYCRLKGTEVKSEKEVVKRYLEEVELSKESNKGAGELSGGQKRRLSVAIALVGKPEVVFLDEPTTGAIPLQCLNLTIGLDPNIKKNLWSVIKRAKEKYGVCIILTTHSMSLLKRV